MMQENYICVSPDKHLGYPNYHIEGFKSQLFRRPFIKSVILHHVCRMLWTKNNVPLDISQYKFLFRFDTVTNRYTVSMFSNYGDAESIHFESLSKKSKELVHLFVINVYSDFYKYQTVDRDMRIAHEWLFADGSNTLNLEMSIRNIFQYDYRPTV